MPPHSPEGASPSTAGHERRSSPRSRHVWSQLESAAGSRRWHERLDVAFARRFAREVRGPFAQHFICRGEPLVLFKSVDFSAGTVFSIVLLTSNHGPSRAPVACHSSEVT